MKLVIITEFEQREHFQWLIALEQYQKELDIEVTPVIAAPVHRRVYPLDDPHWNPIREADAVFVYATRIGFRRNSTGSDWWELPQFVKQFMRSNAKMIAQYDDEWMWLFNPLHVWWTSPNPDNHGGAEQFFKDTGILEVPDAHLSVMNDPQFKKYTMKPTFKLLLPQLYRYTLNKYSKEHKLENIAIMCHSIIQSSIAGILENIIKSKNYPVTIFFGTLNSQTIRKFTEENNLPMGSEVFPRIPCESYEDLLWQNASIGLDDNTGYYGWSRFVLECAIAYIPCVGSTEAVQDLFPELYVKPQDYAKEIELIERLRTDKKFYHEIVEDGHKRCVELLSSKKLTTKLIEIFNQLGTSRTGKRKTQPPELQANSHP